MTLVHVIRDAEAWWQYTSWEGPHLRYLQTSRAWNALYNLEVYKMGFGMRMPCTKKSCWSFCPKHLKFMVDFPMCHKPANVKFWKSPYIPGGIGVPWKRLVPRGWKETPGFHNPFPSGFAWKPASRHGKDLLDASSCGRICPVYRCAVHHVARFVGTLCALSFGVGVQTFLMESLLLARWAKTSSYSLTWCLYIPAKEES